MLRQTILPPAVPECGVPEKGEEKPLLPGKTEAVLLAKQKITEQAGQVENVPDIHCDQPDMLPVLGVSVGLGSQSGEMEEERHEGRHEEGSFVVGPLSESSEEALEMANTHSRRQEKETEKDQCGDGV